MRSLAFILVATTLVALLLILSRPRGDDVAHRPEVEARAAQEGRAPQQQGLAEIDLNASGRTADETEAGSASAARRIPTRPKVTLVVQVEDDEGRPIEGALVRAFDPATGMMWTRGRTGADGTLESIGAEVPEGKVVSARVADWLPFVEPAQPPVDGRQVVTIRMTPPPLSPGLRGRVVHREDERPLEGVELSMVPAPMVGRLEAGLGTIGATRVAPVRTDAEGRFLFPALTAHRHRLSIVARRDGLGVGQVAWRDVESMVEAGEEVTFRMADAVRRTGRVSFRDGSPAEGVMVGIPFAHSGEGWLESTVTDAAGSFVLDLPDAAIQVRAERCRLVEAKVRLEPGDRTRLDIVLPYDGSTRIVVDVQDGTSIEGSFLHILDATTPGPYPVRKGEAIVHHPYSEEVDLVLTHETGDEEDYRILPFARATAVALETEATTVAKFRPLPVGAVRVVATSETRARLGELAAVSLVAYDLPTAGHVSDVEGNVHVLEGLPAGRYDLTTVHTDAPDVCSAEIDVVPGETAEVRL